MCVWPRVTAISCSFKGDSNGSACVPTFNNGNWKKLGMHKSIVMQFYFEGESMHAPVCFSVINP